MNRTTTNPLNNRPPIHLGAPYLFHGGAEKQLRYLIDTLLDENCRVCVHVISNPPESRDLRTWDPSNAAGLELRFYDEDVSALRRRPDRWLLLLFRMFREMRHAHTVYVYSAYFLPLLPFLKLLGKRVLFSERILSPQVTGRKSLYRLARFADMFIVNGESLQEYFGGFLDNVHLISNKVEPILWTANKQETDETDARVAIISRYDPYKNIEFALEALGNRKRLVINVYGAGNPDYKQTLQEAASRLSADVSLHDLTPIERIYEENDLIVHPSLAEGTPNVVIEAMISRKPILASNIREIRDTGIIEDCLFDPRDTRSLNDCLNRYLSRAPGERQDILERNAALAAERYSGERFRHQINAAFRACGAN